MNEGKWGTKIYTSLWTKLTNDMEKKEERKRVQRLLFLSTLIRIASNFFTLFLYSLDVHIAQLYAILISIINEISDRN